MQNLSLAPIKLIVWDLDDTFWQGVYSEGEIEYSIANHNLILELTSRGIINSICSINNYEIIRSFLRKKNIWEYFVFPSISFSPKGPRLKELIDLISIKQENVLFIDNEIKNIEEAKYYLPNLQVSTPEIIKRLMNLDTAKGKKDKNLIRLKQYKLLEKRKEDMQSLNLTAIDFLRQSNINIEIKSNCHENIERIYELITRTNQLNFTKKRISKNELNTILTSPEVKSGYVEAKDKYGDYGIIGFYSLLNGNLDHFMFSCRVMNMGIEQWVYNYLGQPNISISGEVSSDLDQFKNSIDWINQNNIVPLNHEGESAPLAQNQINVSILMKGGCDLDQVIEYTRYKNFIYPEFNYLNQHGVFIHNEHTEFLKQNIQVFNFKNQDIVKKIPFIDEGAFKSKIFQNEYDILIYSVLMDFTQGIYAHKFSDIKIPYLDFQVDVTDPNNWEYVKHKHNISNESLLWFKHNFIFLGALSAEQFAENIMWFYNTIHTQKGVIFINGAEVELNHPIEKKRHLHHKIMNNVLSEVVKDLPRAQICDVRRFIRDQNDIVDNIRHYQRKGYSSIAKEIDNLITIFLDKNKRFE